MSGTLRLRHHSTAGHGLVPADDYVHASLVMPRSRHPALLTRRVFMGGGPPGALLHRQ
jgi:hypothetical protein